MPSCTLVVKHTSMEEPSPDELASVLMTSGFDVRRVLAPQAFTADLLRPGEWVITAGGDGTLTQVADRLRGSPAPLAVLPAGTANNISKVLGVEGDPLQVARRLLPGRTRHFDVGELDGPLGRSHFYEAVGLGLFAEALLQKGVERHKQVPNALRLLLDVLDRLEPRRVSLTVDGQPLEEGGFLLVEVMNVPMIGPNLRLSAHGDVGTGVLDLVTVRAEERPRLRAFLEARLGGAHHTDGFLPARRCSSVALRQVGSAVHLDDAVYWRPECNETLDLSLRILPAALELRLPA